MGAFQEAKERNILIALGQLLGQPDAAPAVDVLSAVAEELGITVEEDGTTHLPERSEADLQEDEAIEQHAKRRCIHLQGDDNAESGPEGVSDDANGAEEDDAGAETSPEPEEPAEDSGSEDEVVELDIAPIEVEDPQPVLEDVDWHQIRDGRAMAEWLLRPVSLAEFTEDIWEKRAMVIHRGAAPSYFDGIFSKGDIDSLLRQPEGLEYTYNVDVTAYREGGRVNLNSNEDGSEGRADPDIVWKRFNEEGCSIRLLHPQRWHDPLWRLLAVLEKHFQCPIGCNTYLTPPASQGFAPHYDDIDAFVLQVEGSKRWWLYGPREAEEILPRYSSRNFSAEEVGEPLMEVVLRPGDLLYMPRGTIHEAQALPETHSLHLTVSANQMRTWADFLRLALPAALELAAQECLALRAGTPSDMFHYMGVVHSDKDAVDPRRAAFIGQAHALLGMVAHHLPLDSATDQIAADFMRSRLPPVPPSPPPAAAATAPAGTSEGASGAGAVPRLRLADDGIARLVVEGGSAVVYHCMANPRGLHMETTAAARAAAAGEDNEQQAASSRLVFHNEAAALLEAVLHHPDQAAHVINERALSEDDAAKGEGVQVQEVLAELQDAGILVPA